MGKIKLHGNNADVFIGVSQAGLLTQDMVKTMAKDPIIFALANPDPEILPDDALTFSRFTGPQDPRDHGL